MLDSGNENQLVEGAGEKTRRRRTRIRIRLPKLGEVATFLVYAGACLYFFNRLRADEFLGRFGLGPGVIPVTSQDAMADGTKALIVNFVALWGPICFIAGLLVFLTTLLRFTGWDRLRRNRRAVSHPRLVAKGLRRLRADPYGELRYTVLLLIAVSPMMILLGALLIAFPASTSARNDVRRAYAALTNGCATCNVYEKRGGGSLKGLLIGSTPDRLFVLSTDCAVRPVRIDDIELIRPVDLAVLDQQKSPSSSKPVACRGRTD